MIQAPPVTVELKSINDEVNLVCISDVHHDQDASYEKLLIQDLKETQKLPNRLLIGVGDELNSISRADKRHSFEGLKEKFTSKDVYPRLIDAEMEDYASILKKYTKPEEWLGHISGNHPLVMTQTQVDPVMNMCNLLGHRYLGYSAFVPLQLKYTTSKVKCMILAHHGYGGSNARKEGSGFNAYIDFALRYEGWDIALFGHRHDRWVKTVPRVVPQMLGGNAKKPAWIRSVDRKVAMCGTYLRTLARGLYPTYSEKFGYPPRPLGCLIIKIGLRRYHTNGHDNLLLHFKGSNE